MLWGWFSMCRCLSTRKQRSCSGLFLELFGLTGSKGTTHCCFWWTKNEQKWWHHLSPRFLCNFKSSSWPGWTQPLPLGNLCTGPRSLPASWHWWHQSWNLSEQNKCELQASQEMWSALGTASLLLYCSVGCNSCTLRVISVHFWRLLCKTSFLYWTEVWQQKGLTVQKTETAESGTQMPFGAINQTPVELLKGCCGERCHVCSCKQHLRQGWTFTWKPLRSSRAACRAQISSLQQNNSHLRLPAYHQINTCIYLSRMTWTKDWQA